jgi:hypothetical protein
MNTWFHYIAKPNPFLQAALKFGVSRHCPINIARGMNFGDRVILLHWRGKAIPPAAFAEMIVNGISFEDGLNVGQELLEQGRCEYHDYTDGGSCAGVQVDRECGSFNLAGGYSLSADVTLQAVIEIAERKMVEQGGKPGDVRCMIWGKIVKVYDVPITPQPAPGFLRGFFHVINGTRIGDAPVVAEPITNEVRVVENYERKMSELQ